jgi:hypothetical protein
MREKTTERAIERVNGRRRQEKKKKREGEEEGSARDDRKNRGKRKIREGKKPSVTFQFNVSKLKRYQKINNK